MLTIFNSESLWIGTDEQRFTEIRTILDNNSVKYKYKTNNHLSEWSGKGTIRGSKGSFGISTEAMYQYEIFVGKSDLEKARYLIR